MMFLNTEKFKIDFKFLELSIEQTNNKILAPNLQTSSSRCFKCTQKTGLIVSSKVTASTPHLSPVKTWSTRFCAGHLLKYFFHPPFRPTHPFYAIYMHPFYPKYSIAIYVLSLSYRLSYICFTCHYYINHWSIHLYIYFT